MTDGIFNADLDQYLRAASIDGPPPAITSDPLIAGLTPTEQLLRMLGLAANADDPADIADIVAQQTERDSGATESARAFGAEDERAGADLNSTAAQITPLIAGIAGAVAGARLARRARRAGLVRARVSAAVDERARVGRRKGCVECNRLHTAILN
jgi:hypothetical protein